MPRYPAGTGKRPNQKKKLIPIQKSVQSPPPAAAPPKAPPGDELDRIIGEMETEEALVNKDKQIEQEKIDKKLNPEVKEEEFDEKAVQKIADGYAVLIEMGLSGIGEGLEIWAEDKRANITGEPKENIVNGLSVLTALLWPDLGGLTPREKMMLAAIGLTAKGVIDHGKIVYGLKTGSIPKLEEKKESSNATSTTADQINN